MFISNTNYIVYIPGHLLVREGQKKSIQTYSYERIIIYLINLVIYVSTYKVCHAFRIWHNVKTYLDQIF